MPRSHALAALVALALLGFALRVHALDRVPFRGDEAFTALNWVQRPLLVTLASDIPLRDPQPPLAYATFWFWGQLFGNSEFALRLLPALVSVVAIPALYALGARLSGRPLGVVAALLWSVHPYAIWHAQDARNYALWSVLSLLALWLALSALSRQRAVDWALYAVVAVAAAYVYYLELFVVVALNVFVLAMFWHCPATLKKWLAVQAIIALVLAPWFLQERLLVGSGYSGTAQSADPVRLFDRFLLSFTFGEALPAQAVMGLWLVAVGFVGLGFYALRRVCWLCAVFVLLLGVLPPFMLVFVALRLDVFTPRYVLGSVPVYVLAVASFVVFGADSLGMSRWRRTFAVTGLGIWLALVLGVVLRFYYHDYAKAPNWRALAQYLHNRLDDKALVVQTAADEAFTYYFNNRSDHQRLPANPHQPAEEIVQILEADQKQYTSIWLVANPPADWPNASVSADWLTANMQLIRLSLLAELPARQFMPWTVSSAELSMLNTEKVRFGDIAYLLGVRLLYPVEPDGSLIVLGYWQPIQNAESDLKVFVHLVPADSTTKTPVAQDDQHPQDGRISSLAWAGVGLFRDVYALPVGTLPAGSYEMFIGLYDSVSGVRVPLSGDRDSYHAATIDLPQS